MCTENSNLFYWILKCLVLRRLHWNFRRIASFFDKEGIFDEFSLVFIWRLLENFTNHITFYPSYLKTSPFQVKFNRGTSKAIRQLFYQVLSGSPYTNFWLLFTLNVLNILFFGTPITNNSRKFWVSGIIFHLNHLELNRRKTS
jgi:hypothetical protein